jgi:nucleotide-binding universal stress UspA family protein
VRVPVRGTAAPVDDDTETATISLVGDRGGELVGRVLVAVPETDVDSHAVHEALGLIRADHDLVFLTFYQGVPSTLAGEGMVDTPLIVPEEAFEDADAEARASGGRKVRELLDELGLQGIVRVETGDPGERIRAVAIEEHADLIVMGSHHAGALRRLLGGSVADDVTHHAPCPVLLIRPKNSAK